MNLSEQVQIIVAMQERWPDKFNETDLKTWADALAVFPFFEVQVALSNFKNSHAFPPKIPEIRAMLPNQPKAAAPPDGATQRYQVQREECKAAARSKGAATDFVSQLPEAEYAQLRAEAIAAMPAAIRPIAEKVGRNHGLITTKIFELVKKQSAGVA